MLKTLALPGAALFALLLIILGVQLVRALDDFRDTRYAESFGDHSNLGRKTSKFFLVVILGIGTVISACGFVVCVFSIL